MACSVSSISISLAVISFGFLPIGSSARNRRSANDLPWDTPCGTVTTSGDPVPLTEANLADLSHELHLRTLEAHSLSQTIKDTFFVSRLSSSNSMAQAVEGYHLANFPLPSDVFFWTHTNDTGEVAKRDYNNLSVLTVFLEEVRFDDIEHHNSSNTATIQYLESKIRAILCQLTSILATLNLSIDSHVTRDVMPDSLREMTAVSWRQQRDYIIAKDCVHLLTSTKDSHLAMRLGHQ